MLGDACIQSAAFEGAPIQICTYAKFAGAIGSLKWKGVEFVNRSDHGRELQSAVNYDGKGEAENPTEAGSGADGKGPSSTSVLQAIKAVGAKLMTTIRMAYWKPVEGRKVSDTLLSKTVTIGWHGLANVIEYDVSLKVDSTHSQFGFEALTAYMPPSFDEFYTYHAGVLQKLRVPANHKLKMIGQNLPIIVVNRSRGVALGVWSQPPTTYVSAIFTSGFFQKKGVTKWSVYYQQVPVPAKTYTYMMLLAVGSPKSVAAAMDHFDR
jgi:hypothetical protein